MSYRMTQMESMLRLVEIGEAAVAVERQREATAAVKKKRHAYDRCDNAEKPSGPPCWKHYVATPGYDGEIDQELLDRDEWCRYCLKRQEAHEEYVRQRNKLGGMRAGLARRCQHYLREASERELTGGRHG